MARDDLPETPPIARLLAVMARLRDPDGGCPWDLEQDFASIAPYTIEEAYEVADAIANGDMAQLREELGDLLLQVVYHAQMAEEDGAFDFDTVAQGIADKMVRRHPHVFGETEIENAAAQTASWEAQKAEERARKATAEGRRPSVLDGVAAGLPALTRAEKLQKRAARVGFDWPAAEPVFDKIAEEIAELRQEIATGAEPFRLSDEIGDLLFAVANLARHLEIDPEEALRGTNRKFERRFRHIEQALEEQGKSPGDCSLDALEALWQAAKAGER
ncbi:MAG TPA: nucleoside triphosphate pyrophosphohydrolase [Alphaproteobacteria bacterium]|nr:nucleoside triphosphate pyrophosphohydrolase [Alphaproteobacteria bacterium]